MGKETPRFMITTKESTGETLSVTGISEQDIQKQLISDLIHASEHLRHAQAQYKRYFDARPHHTKDVVSPRDIVFAEAILAG